MTQHQVIANHRRSLLIFAERWGISQACKNFNVSRTTYYKIKKQFMTTGSLEPRLRHKPRMPNEIALSKKKLLLKLVQEHPTWGTPRYAHAFQQQGIAIDQSTLWHHLKKYGLNRRFHRLLYVEKLRAHGQPLTERTLKQIKQHIHTVKHSQWPGHIVALDTFYIGNLKGVGRIYQVTGIDLYSRFGWAQVYSSKDQSSTCHFLEHVLLPKFFHNGVTMESVLTDNGSEFAGSKFKQLLHDYDIAHYRIPKGKPLCNGYCERFQRTIYEEFYQVQFRKKVFRTIDGLTTALIDYLAYYNFKRAHFGIDKKGIIPIELFKTKNSYLQHRFQKLLA